MTSIKFFYLKLPILICLIYFGNVNIIIEDLKYGRFFFIKKRKEKRGDPQSGHNDLNDYSVLL